MSKAKELAEQMFPEPQMENYDDILEYRNANKTFGTMSRMKLRWMGNDYC